MQKKTAHEKKKAELLHNLKLQQRKVRASAAKIKVMLDNFDRTFRRHGS